MAGRRWFTVPGLPALALLAVIPPRPYMAIVDSRHACLTVVRVTVNRSDDRTMSDLQLHFGPCGGPPTDDQQFLISYNGRYRTSNMWVVW